MRFSLLLVLAALGVLLLVASSCENDSVAPLAGFAPDARSPGSSQVYLSFDGASGLSVVVSVRVRELSGIHAADLRLTYDPARVLFRSSAPGAILEQGGGFIDYDVAEETPGVLHVVARRTTVGDVSADATAPRLVQLAFDVLLRGAAPVSFSTSTVAGPSGNPLPGIRFFGGTITRS